MPSAFETTELRTNQRVVALRRRRLRIDVLRGPDRKLSREIVASPAVIGSHPGCDVALTDPTVSRQHVELLAGEGGLRVRDLGSTNGTFYQGARVGEIRVVDRCQIRLGETVLRIDAGGDSIDVPLAEAESFGPLLGRSAEMRQIFSVLARVAPTDATVLLTGESGTGKEVAARAIHEASARAGQAFVVVDCGSLPATLIESALFGHERGAFTGAERARVGAFEAGHGGTVFLDEIGELPLELQSRLLGVLERRQVQPLGTTDLRPVDVRIVAATNRDLRREVNRGAFREDLYFRLAVVVVTMPALRERPEDVPLYVEAFLGEARDAGMSLALDPATIAQLAAQPWPGNVRELRNALERAAALGEVASAPGAGGPGALPGAAREALSVAVDTDVPFKVAKGLLTDEWEKAYIIELMQRHGHNITRAARAAEIDRVYLLRLLDKHGVPRRPRG